MNGAWTDDNDKPVVFSIQNVARVFSSLQDDVLVLVRERKFMLQQVRWSQRVVATNLGLVTYDCKFSSFVWGWRSPNYDSPKHTSPVFHSASIADMFVLNEHSVSTS
ncbi:hypothetical protein QG37_00478 [Candidozyma auris]|nr:hypothetical protein QG37_00478 [[Candida] auris]